MSEAEAPEFLRITNGVKIALQIAIAVFIGQKTLAIGEGTGINLPGVLSIVALVMSAASLALSSRRLYKGIAGQEPDDPKAAARLRNIRNGLTQFVLVNCAFQVGHNVDGEDAGDIYAMTSILALVLAAVDKILLDPAVDLGGITKVLDVKCIDGNRNTKRLSVFVMLVASLIFLSVDIEEKGGLPGKYSDDHVAILATVIALVSLHLLLLILGMLGQQFKVLKMCALGSSKSGDCDEEKSSFHGLNELPLVRSVVTGSVVLLLSFMIGEEVAKSKNAAVLAGSLISAMLASSLGRNVV